MKTRSKQEEQFKTLSREELAITRVKRSYPRGVTVSIPPVARLARIEIDRNDMLYLFIEAVFQTVRHTKATYHLAWLGANETLCGQSMRGMQVARANRACKACRAPVDYAYLKVFSLAARMGMTGEVPQSVHVSPAEAYAYIEEFFAMGGRIEPDLKRQPLPKEYLPTGSGKRLGQFVVPGMEIEHGDANVYRWPTGSTDKPGVDAGE